MKQNNSSINIHGLRYKKLVLIKKNFKEVHAGQNVIQKILLSIFGIFATSTCSLIPVISGHLLASIITYFGLTKHYGLGFILVSIAIYCLALVLIVFRGWEVTTIIFTIIVTILSTISTSIEPDVGLGAGVFFLIISIVSAWLGTTIIAYCIAFINLSDQKLAEFLAILGAGLVTVFSITLLISNSKRPEPGEGIIAIITAFAVIFTGVIITHNALNGYSKFAWIREKAVFWAATGGTSFYGADLTDACFDGADLPHTDFRKAILTRTSFEDATRLDLSRLQGTILEQPKVRKLLVTKRGEDQDYTGANFEGANLRGADLTKAILKEVKALDADFSEATLTGACIENWSINSETRFTGVQCDYIYRELDQNGEGTARYPVDRKFEPGEFESLYQEVGNVVELIFKEGMDWRALSFSFQKLQLDDEGLGLELKGIEKRGDLWVVKVAYKEGLARPMVEERVSTIYDDIKNLLAIKEQQINKLLGIASDQAEALKNQSRQPFGNSFFIFGSTITNLAGSGQIEYDEAASKIRSIVANSGDIGQVAPIAQNLLQQLQTQSVATSSNQQVELIEQVILNEANTDPFFKQFLVQQSQQIAEAMPESAITTAIQNAIAKLNQSLP